MITSLSKRGQANVKDMPPLVHAHFSTVGDMYTPDENPYGYINMGTAETHLMNDEIIELLQKSHTRTKFNAKHIHYDHFHGSEEFRTAIANYWQTVIFAKGSPRHLTSENIVVGAGCSLALEMLATMLGDPGDVILIPAPYYSGFIDDISARAELTVVGVHCSENLSRNAFESALSAQKRNGKTVRAVLLSSPNNPIGTVYSAAALKTLIDFCMTHDLDIISDEIYAQTIHDPDTQWTSLLSLVPDDYLHRVHVTSSFAKDFALSGFRTGFAISFNSELLKGMQALAYYSAVSTHTQALLTEFLQAPELPKIIENSKIQLHEAYKKIEKTLNELGVKTLPAQGGIFILADFSSFLTESTFESENHLWKRIFQELKINISPGQLFDCATPGWFRICYAHPLPIIEEACRRLKSFDK